MQTTAPLGRAADENIELVLDWVVVRNGPGSWARNANWDEYLLRVRNNSESQQQVLSLVVFDSLSTRTLTNGDRRELVELSDRTVGRYRRQDIRVEPGSGVDAMTATGAVMVLGGAAVAVNTASAGFIFPTYSASAGALLAGGVVLMAGAGVYQLINNREVSDHIETRQTRLPLFLEPGEEAALDLFFPVAPSPLAVQLNYRNSSGNRTLVLDTRLSLEGLHYDE